METPDHKEVIKLYNPLKRKLRKLDVEDSLYFFWSYSRNYCFNYPFHRSIEIPAKYPFNGELNKKRLNGIQEFEMEFLIRHIILENGSIFNGKKKTLRRFKDFVEIINYLRSDLDNGLHNVFVERDILLDMHRLSHRQFRWQVGYNQELVLRNYKIYSSPKIDAIVKSKFGLKTHQIFLVGLFLFSLSARSFKIKIPLKSESNLLTTEMIDKFLEKFSCDISDLKDEMKKSVRYDQTLFYSYNPLISNPLIKIDGHIICPIHLLLFWQFQSGIYYEIQNENGFENAYGQAFENYIGEVINENIRPKRFAIFGEITYGKENKKSSDWIIEGKHGILFIECKTKRLTIPSKSEIDISKGLESDLRKMAKFISQPYKTFIDFKNGQYKTIEYDSSKKFIPLIITLEPWYIHLNFRIPEILAQFVKEEFEKKNIDKKLLETNPYHIMSAQEFESKSQIIDKLGIKKYFEIVNTEKSPKLHENFKHHSIFKGEFEKLFVTYLKNEKL